MSSTSTSILATLPPASVRRRVLQTADAAAFLGISEATFRRLKKRNELPDFIKVTERLQSYRLGDLEDWLESRSAGLTWHEFQAAKAGNDNRPRPA